MYELNLDCIGVIVTFLRSCGILTNVLLTSRRVKKYVEQQFPIVCENVFFKLKSGHSLPQTVHNHVVNLEVLKHKEVTDSHFLIPNGQAPIFPNLRRLTLIGCVSVKGQFLRHCQKIQELTLERCVEFQDSEHFGHISHSLRLLRVEMCSVKICSFLKKMTELRTLTLGNFLGSMENLTGEDFKPLTHLRALSLYYSPSLNSELFKYVGDRLTMLELSNCSLFQEKGFEHLKKLKKCTIQYCRELKNEEALKRVLVKNCGEGLEFSYRPHMRKKRGVCMKRPRKPRKRGR